MSITLGFDVYGTLIDTNGVVEVLRSQVGALAPEFSRRWREKQLEYSFRRGLMQNYQDFAVCTRQALDYTSVVTGAGLSEAQKSVLLEAYQGLPAFPDVKLGLQRASEAQMRLFAFSNGSANAVAQLLDGAGIGDCFLDIISVEQLRSFKPSPAVYCHFLRRTSARGMPPGSCRAIRSTSLERSRPASGRPGCNARRMRYSILGRLPPA